MTEELAIERHFFALTDLQEGQWERLSKERQWNEVELRDRRYDQVIHLMSAAKGAVEFYTCEGHGTRSEGIQLASHLDDMVAQVS